MGGWVGRVKGVGVRGVEVGGGWGRWSWGQGIGVWGLGSGDWGRGVEVGGVRSGDRGWGVPNFPQTPSSPTPPISTPLTPTLPTQPQPITVVWRIFRIGTDANVCPTLTLKFSSHSYVSPIVWRIFFAANLLWQIFHVANPLATILFHTTPYYSILLALNMHNKSVNKTSVAKYLGILVNDNL